MLNQEHPLASTEMQLYGVGRAYEKTLQIDRLATFALCHPLGGLSTGGKPDIAAGQGLPQHMVPNLRRRSLSVIPDAWNPLDYKDRQEHASFRKECGLALSGYIALEGERLLLYNNINEPVAWHPNRRTLPGRLGVPLRAT